MFAVQFTDSLQSVATNGNSLMLAQSRLYRATTTKHVYSMERTDLCTEDARSL